MESGQKPKEKVEKILKQIPKFRITTGDLWYTIGTYVIVCTAKQRKLVEKMVFATRRFMVDERKYATTYHIANGSRIIVMHERLLTPVITVEIDLDLREWTDDAIKEHFK